MLSVLALLQVAEYENCRLLLVDKKITSARDIVGVLVCPSLLLANSLNQ